MKGNIKLIKLVKEGLSNADNIYNFYEYNVSSNKIIKIK